MEFYDCPYILGMSLSQLTFTPSFFRGVGSPHQPVKVWDAKCSGMFSQSQLFRSNIPSDLYFSKAKSSVVWPGWYISTPEYNLGQISRPGIWPEIADACYMFAECSGASFDSKTATYFCWSLVKNSCFPGDANISWLVGRSNRTQPVSHWESKYAGWGTYEPWMQSIYFQKRGWYHHSLMGSTVQMLVCSSFVDWLLE